MKRTHIKPTLVILVITSTYAWTANITIEPYLQDLTEDSIKFIWWTDTQTEQNVAHIFLTHLPQETVPEQLQEDGPDKLHHIVAYETITLFFVLSIKNSFSLWSAVILFFLVLAIAAIDELTQPLVNRQARPMDWLADTIGVAVILFSFFFTGSKHKVSMNVGI